MNKIVKIITEKGKKDDENYIERKQTDFHTTEGRRQIEYDRKKDRK